MGYATFIPMLVLICVSSSVFCDTPEDAVKGMLDAVKAEEWEKVVSYIDIEGMVDYAKAVYRRKLEALPDEKREAAAKELEALDAEKVRKGTVKKMQDVFGSDFEYRILGTEETDEDKAVVIVEFKRKDKTRNDAIPTAKIDGKWMVSFRDLVSFKEKKQTEK